MLILGEAIPGLIFTTGNGHIVNIAESTFPMTPGAFVHRVAALLLVHPVAQLSELVRNFKLHGYQTVHLCTHPVVIKVEKNR